MPTAMRFLFLLFLTATALTAADYQFAPPNDVERDWIGPEFWAAPLQDWRLRDGRVELHRSGGNRHLYLLTHEIAANGQPFSVSVRLGRLDSTTSLDAGWAGFRLGIKAPFGDYRTAVLRGKGLNVGVITQGKPFVGDEQAEAAARRRDRGFGLEDVVLTLDASPANGRYDLVLSVREGRTNRQLRSAELAGVAAEQLAGGIALVGEHAPDGPTMQNSYAAQSNRRGGNVRLWFRDFSVKGTAVEEHADRAWGPILWTQYTLSHNVLKLTAQMVPVGRSEAGTVRLEVRRDGEWTQVGEEHIHTLARTATFRITDWDDAADVPYRVVYGHTTASGVSDVAWEGTVRKNPADQRKISVGAFTGNKDTAFPNLETVANIEHHNPDVLFFSGDQIYEDVAGFGIERGPVETATLDYLRKWWLVGWSFGDLMRDRPTIHMPDDHDVYQGNIWGGGGRALPMTEHERGGYVMPWEWVNAVQRTQVAHMPDPYDPRPIDQGITVYYGEFNYGRISFGVLEDRKFKSGPKGMVPETGGRPDHVTDPKFDRDAFDPPGGEILGERQLAFVRDWTSDWRESDMKVSLTQTIFANAATTHGANMMRLVADLDSNGWPRSARARALRELRKGFVFMLGGDQHLPSIIHHGADEFGDAGWSFCVPSISAGYPRSYEPEIPSKNRPAGAPDYAGEQLDGLGNKMTIWAVANPVKNQRRPTLEKLHDKASGYGILTLDKKTGEITMACYKLLQDASDGGEQFDDWPKTIRYTDNYARKPAAHLSEIAVEGLENPVIQVVEEASGEIVYTLRIRGDSFRPPVFDRTAKYTVRVGEPERGLWQELQDQTAGDGKLVVSF